MNEQPRWNTGASREEPSEYELDKEMELAVVRQVILDEALKGWEEKIDPRLLDEYRTEIQKMTDKEIITFCKNNYVWDDPTYAKALVDVISGKITSPLGE